MPVTKSNHHTKINFQFAQDVDSGLNANPKYLSSKYFYNDKGDNIFQKIMQLDEYYLTRSEHEIFNLNKKKWFQITEAPDLMKDVPILVIDENVDAIFSKKDDSLYFKKIARIKSIFQGVEELYREATNEEVSTF